VAGRGARCRTTGAATEGGAEIAGRGSTSGSASKSLKSIGSGVTGRAIAGGGALNGEDSGDGSESWGIPPGRGIPGGGFAAGAANGTAAIG
jgi:hypothetical protein